MVVTPEQIEAFLDGQPVPQSVVQEIEAQLDDPNSLVQVIGRRTSNAVRRFANGSGSLPIFVPQALAHSFSDLENLNRECAAFFRSGDWPNALELRLETCRLAFRYLGPMHRDSGTFLNALGRILLEIRDFMRAARVFQSAIDIRAAALGERHSDVGISWTGLGRALEGLGEYPESLNCHRLALKTMEAELGSNHPDTGVNLSELGVVSLTVGDFATARSCFQRALEIAREIDGEDDPIYAGALLHMGCIEEAIGDLQTAEKHFRAALVIMETARGPYHEDVAWALDQLGGLLLSMGNTSGSLRFLTRAAETVDNFGAEPTSLSLSIYNNLAVAQATNNDQAQAFATCTKALDFARQLWGEQHPSTIFLQRNLSILADCQIPNNLMPFTVTSAFTFLPVRGQCHSLVQLLAA